MNLIATRAATRYNRYFYGILTALICCEGLLFYSSSGIVAPRVNSVLEIVAGLGLGIMMMTRRRPAEVSAPPRHIRPASGKWILTGVFILLTIPATYQLNKIFVSTEITPLNSDIIPIIRVAVRRLLAGDNVYRQITEIGYPLPLTYLPMQWMPFSLAEMGSVDYRWIPFFAWLIVAGLYARRMSGTGLKSATGLLLLLFGALFFLILEVPGIFGATVELLIAAYYLLLLYAITSKNSWLKALAITLCLLSRYIIVLWLPLLLYIELQSGARRHTLKTGFLVMAGVLLLYVIPFLSKDPGIFPKSYDYYTKATVGEWQHLDDNHQPFQLYNGSGLAWVFYEKLNKYSIADRVKSLQKAHLLLCLLSVAGMGIYYRVRRLRLDKNHFLIGSFKVYLTVFLAFIQIPYVYLTITAFFCSVAGLMLLRTGAGVGARAAIVIRGFLQSPSARRW